VALRCRGHAYSTSTPCESLKTHPAAGLEAALRRDPGADGRSSRWRPEAQERAQFYPGSPRADEMDEETWNLCAMSPRSSGFIGGRRESRRRSRQGKHQILPVRPKRVWTSRAEGAVQPAKGARGRRPFKTLTGCGEC